MLIGVRSMRGVVVAMVACASLVGCGETSEVGSGADSPATDVEQYIMSMSDIAGSPAFSQQFVEGSAPAKADLKKYASLEFEPAAKPVFSGDDACFIEVKVFEAQSGNERGTVQWSLVKSDKGWRLKQAPLP